MLQSYSCQTCDIICCHVHFEYSIFSMMPFYKQFDKCILKYLKIWTPLQYSAVINTPATNMTWKKIVYSILFPLKKTIGSAYIKNVCTFFFLMFHLLDWGLDSSSLVHHCNFTTLLDLFWKKTNSENNPFPDNKSDNLIE